MIIAGVDIGKRGGIARIVDGQVFVDPLPFDSDNALDVNVYADLLRSVDLIYIEEPFIPGGMANKGTKVAITDYGQLLGIAKLTCPKVVTVTARQWKHYFKLSKDKQESIDMAKKMYPNVNLLRTKRSKKECDGMAEAILIARYAMACL